MGQQQPSTKILVLNCGSSSIKYQLHQMPERKVLCRGLLDRLGQPDAVLEHRCGEDCRRREVDIADHAQGVELILQTLTQGGGELGKASEIGAVGHRVVHGGEQFAGSVLVTPEVIDSVERFAELAPLHNPPNLAGIRAVAKLLPGLPQVACFDTAFHATLPEVAYLYALPYEVYEKHRIRRYGFHGTSHRYVARRAAELLGKHKYEINCITAHLGNGCSMTAVREGRSVDTSMGLTPLEGLIMGTRSGDFDPAVIFHLERLGYKTDELDKMCNKRSGLLGISGLSNDMRTLLEAAHGGQTRAQLAIDMFCYRIKKYLGMYLAVLGHVDAVVFTGGIGENVPLVRAKACQGMEPLGLIVDEQQNQQLVGRREGCFSTPESRTRLLVVPTDEEAAIAADTYQIAILKE